MAGSGGHLRRKVNAEDCACLPHGPSKGAPPQQPLLLYQMVQRWSSRFCCRALWFLNMVSNSIFTAGGVWILSLAMNSLGVQTHRHHAEERRGKVDGREGMRPMVRTFRTLAPGHHSQILPLHPGLSGKEGGKRGKESGGEKNGGTSRHRSGVGPDCRLQLCDLGQVAPAESQFPLL